MNENKINEVILDLVNTYGPLSVPEMIYSIQNNILYSIDLSSNKNKQITDYDIQKVLNSLIENKKIREFVCDTGYKRRYGIPELDTSFKLSLKIEKKICPECGCWIIIYFKKVKHLEAFFCASRLNSDTKDIVLCNYKAKIKFIIYENLFLGVIDNGVLRLPKVDRFSKIPELIIASKICMRKGKNKNLFKNLKFNFQEVFC